MPQFENIQSLFLAMQKRLAKTVSQIVPPKEVEDIVQETYVRICEVSHQETIQYPRAYLFKVAKNLALDHVKRAETRLTVSMETDEELDFLQDDFSDVTFDQTLAKEEFELLCRAVRELPQQSRKAFVLRKVYGFSQKEIAERLDISENTVEKHIALGIKRCSYFMARHHSLPSQRHEIMPSNTKILGGESL